MGVVVIRWERPVGRLSWKLNMTILGVGSCQAESYKSNKNKNEFHDEQDATDSRERLNVLEAASSLLIKSVLLAQLFLRRWAMGAQDLARAQSLARLSLQSSFPTSPPHLHQQDNARSVSPRM